MFEFCEKNIRGIRFVYITASQVTETKSFLKTRFLNAFTISGSRNFNQFDPLDNLRTATKRCSEDDEIALIHNFGSNAIEAEIDVLPFKHACCMYEHLWWIGMMQDIKREEADIAVKFMHPHGPSASFKWPSRDAAFPMYHLQILVEHTIYQKAMSTK